MSNPNSCCGSIPQSKSKNLIPNLPENPLVEAPVEIIYLASGDVKIDNTNSGKIYFASDQRRFINVETIDANDILKNSDFILRP